MAAAEALIQDERRSLRAQRWSGNAQQSMILAMQAAYIEWMLECDGIRLACFIGCLRPA
jgi:hypothetical protein